MILLLQLNSSQLNSSASQEWLDFIERHYQILNHVRKIGSGLVLKFPSSIDSYFNNVVESLPDEAAK